MYVATYARTKPGIISPRSSLPLSPTPRRKIWLAGSHACSEGTEVARARTPEGESGDHFSAPTFARKFRAPWRPDGGSFIIHGQQEGSQYMKSLLRFALRDFGPFCSQRHARSACARSARA